MKIQYDHLRPEQADSFDLDNFKSELSRLTDFNEQLSYWNRYFNLPSMGRRLSVDSDDKVFFHFYCEGSECRKGFTHERQATLTNWRREYYEPLKKQFDQLTTYRERIDFARSHFGTAFGKFTPENGIEFNTMPQNSDEQQLYDQIRYKGWEKRYLKYIGDKSFTERKRQFDERIINTLHPNEELQKEIDLVRNEYEQPEKKWDKHLADHNQHIIVFRQRLKGHLLNIVKEIDERRTPKGMQLYFEGEQAYKYYEYLVKLQQKPNWLEKLKKCASPIVSVTSAKNEEKTDEAPITQACLALFYYYAHEKGCLRPFQAGNLEWEYKKATEPYDLSWKSFQQHYNRFKKQNERMAEGNRKALLNAIKMLEIYPKALEQAKDELKTAETRKPYT